MFGVFKEFYFLKSVVTICLNSILFSSVAFGQAQFNDHRVKKKKEEIRRMITRNEVQNTNLIENYNRQIQQCLSSNCYQPPLEPPGLEEAVRQNEIYHARSSSCEYIEAVVQPTIKEVKDSCRFTEVRDSCLGAFNKTKKNHSIMLSGKLSEQDLRKIEKCREDAADDIMAVAQDCDILIAVKTTYQSWKKLIRDSVEENVSCVEEIKSGPQGEMCEFSYSSLFDIDSQEIANNCSVLSVNQKFDLFKRNMEQNADLLGEAIKYNKDAREIEQMMGEETLILQGVIKELEKNLGRHDTGAPSV